MENLKELRKSKNLTLKNVSDITSICVSDLSKLENKKRHLTVEQARKFAALYEVSVDAIVGGPLTTDDLASPNQAA